MKDDLIVLGKLGSSYGVNGFIKVVSFTDPVEKILDYAPLYLKKTTALHDLIYTEHKVFKNGNIIIKLEGVDNPEDARLLTGSEILVSRSALPDPNQGSYYWHDLAGLNVTSKDGGLLGKVDYLFNAGASDIIVVKPVSGKDILIPYVDHVVLEVNLSEGYIKVDWDV